MNERIRELAKQAGMGFGKPFKQTEDTLYIKSDKVADAIATDAGTHQEQVLKFAELIVRECAFYMYENYPHSRYEVNYMRRHMGDADWNKPIKGQLELNDERTN